MERGAEMPLLVEQHREWTFEDLQALPEDVDWRRFEIVDGSLVVSPSASSRHGFVIAFLRDVLGAAARPDFLVIGSMGVTVGRSYRIPDLLVVRAALAAEDVNPLPAADVLLAVEVVSPGSETTDRITKPAQYAAAGIPAYWRVETRPLVTLTAYELRTGDTVYREVGTWGPGETARLAVPFAVEVPIDAITPPQG